MLNRTLRTAVLSAVSLACQANGQVIFQENFNDSGATAPGGPYPPGPPLLAQRGWIFRNQCQPLGTINWLDAWSFSGPSALDYDGSFLRTHLWAIALNSTGTQSMWAVLPDVPALSAGDIVRFVLRSFGPNQHVEVRLSPTGGTSTGSGAAAVGDFTTLVADLAVPNNIWSPVSIVVPAGGRLAIRHFATQAGPSGPNAGAVWIDAMEITEPTGPNVIVWTSAASPHVIAGTRLIDANTILHIEAGATVHLNPGATLRIEGRADALGTAANPVIFTGTAPYPDAPKVVIADGGHLELDHADVQCWIEPLVGDIFGNVLAGDLTARHSRFHGPGQVYTNGYAAGQSSVLVVEDCTFESQSAFWHQACQARLRNLTFLTPGTFPGAAAVLWGHMNVDNLVSDGVALWFGDNKYGGQAQYLNNLSVSNLPVSAGLLLDARNNLLGPNVNIQNTDVPIEFGASGATGLLPGSHVPATGNINNIVLDTSRNAANPTAVMGAIWAPVGVPYVIPGGTLLTTGDIDILPGVRIILGQGVQWEWFGFFNAEGTAQQPIVFENFSPELRWDRMLARTGLARLDHCEIRGGGFGIETFSGFARISNMLIEDCTTALRASDGTFWEVTKSRIHGNVSGLFGAIWADGGTTPNSIAGNSEFGALNGATNSARVRGNWWGSPTGPTTPANPGGTGDVVFGDVLFQPFLTSAPDFANQTPTVRIVDTHHRIFEPGSKIIIHWSATDDGSIAEQRVLFSATDAAGTHQLLATLPAGQRSFEWTVPHIGLNFSFDPTSTLRVEAVDNTGQIGWDEQVCLMAIDQSQGTLDITTPFQPAHEFGDMFSTTWTHGGWPVADLPSVFGRIMFENDFTWQELGGNHASQGVLSGNQFMGNVSTDFARLHLHTSRSQFQGRDFFSEPFAIRPDPRMGDAPPAVNVTGPAPGSSFPGGASVPLAWTASDDEGIRSFDIIASYDGGRLWYPIVRDLPASTGSYTWNLPPSTGIPDVRVRVIARDLRFQNSSSVVRVAITATGACYANCDGSTGTPLLTANDFVCFINAYASGAAYANCDGSTGTPALTGNDFLCFLNRFAAGCP